MRSRSAKQSSGSAPVSLSPHRLVYRGLLGATGTLMILGTLIAARSLLTSDPQSSAVSAASSSLPVEVLRLEPVTSYQVSRIYTGEIAALRTSDLGFERSGALVEIWVDEGQQVAAGTPLARLDVQNLQAQRTQLQAQVAQAEAQLEELTQGPRSEDIAAAAAAVRDLEKQLALQEVQATRRESLYAQGAISREQLDEFSFGVEALEARLAQAQSNLQELLNGTRPEQIAAQQAVVQQLQASVLDLEVTLSKSTLVAPFAGIVSTRQINEGTVVSPGQSVIRLVELDTPEARIGLPAPVVGELSLGDAHPVQINGRSIQAQVVSILPEVDPITRTRTVVLGLAGISVLDVAPGQTVRWELPEIIQLQGEGYWLPTDALTQGLRGLWSCYVLLPPGSDQGAEPGSFAVSQQSVEVLHQDGDRVLVRGTIEPGNQIVASGVHRLVPGQWVTPLDPAPPQASL